MYTIETNLEKSGDNGFPDYNQDLEHFNFTGIQKLFWVIVDDYFLRFEVPPNNIPETKLFLRSTKVHYYAELKEVEWITVSLCARSKGRTSITFGSEARFKDGRLIATAEFMFVAVDSETGKPKKLPKSLADLPVEE